jgi:hypothetical protein
MAAGYFTSAFRISLTLAIAGSLECTVMDLLIFPL